MRAAASRRKRRRPRTLPRRRNGKRDERRWSERKRTQRTSRARFRNAPADVGTVCVPAVRASRVSGHAAGIRALAGVQPANHAALPGAVRTDRIRRMSELARLTDAEIKAIFMNFARDGCPRCVFVEHYAKALLRAPQQDFLVLRAA